MNKRADLTLHGQVQGVSFRITAQKWAAELNLTGYVQNNPDKTLIISIQGDQNKVEEFISRCYDGPKWARVTDIIIKWRDQIDPHLTSFEIKYPRHAR